MNIRLICKFFLILVTSQHLTGHSLEQIEFREISKTTKSLCIEPVKYYIFRKARYQLTHTDDKQHIIRMKLFITYLGKEKNEDLAFELFDRAQDCIKEFWAKHKIKFQLVYERDPSIFKWLTSHHAINLWDTRKREDPENWATISTQGKELDDQLRCNGYLHEIGHLLGLSDTYYDSHCPDRDPIRENDDIMANTTGNPEDLRFYPEDIKIIISE